MLHFLFDYQLGNRRHFEISQEEEGELLVILELLSII